MTEAEIGDREKEREGRERGAEIKGLFMCPAPPFSCKGRSIFVTKPLENE